MANRAFYKLFKMDMEQVEKRSLFKIGSGAWNSPQLKQLLEATLQSRNSFEEFNFSHEFDTIGFKNLILNED